MRRWIFALCFGAMSTTVLAQQPVVLQTPHLKFSAYPEDGRWTIEDFAGQVMWNSGARTHFGQVTATTPTGKRQVLELSKCRINKSEGGLQLAFRPLAADSEPVIQVQITPAADGRSLRFAWDASPQIVSRIESIRLLDGALSTMRGERGCVLVPVRMGLMIPADSGIAFTRSFDTSQYEGCHMNMLGVVKAGATALLTWEDPYVAPEVKSELAKAGEPGEQTLSVSITLRKTARSFSLHLGGQGDWNTIAALYRDVARSRGLLVPWSQKIAQNPERQKLLGASNVKLWTALNRKMNEESNKELSVNVQWTFDEVAQVAQHLKNDLKLDKVLFTLGGWTHRGYDSQHPDVTPAAPECGGNEALARCARATMDLGYLFCLHDNYQDMYRDAPSWDEKWLQIKSDGTPQKGGVWLGGRAYMTCAQKAYELSRRPQNLPEVKKITGANAYFIDTTYAVGLQECYSKDHPLLRDGDMKWKIAMSDFARETFGIFGSECGREWAIPHADFFEGLSGVSGRHYHDEKLEATVGGVVVPLFEMVYRDCIAIHGKYGYDIRFAAPYVLHHISLGRPLNYHSLGAHLYWKQAAPKMEVQRLTPAVAQFKQVDRRAFSIQYDWNVELSPSIDWQIFVHFLDLRGVIKFQNDHAPGPAMTQWRPGHVRQGPFMVRVPEGLTGTFDLRIGLHDSKSGQRATLASAQDREHRTLLGRVKIEGDTLSFTPASEVRTAPLAEGLYARAEHGWGEDLCEMDRFIKNTHEILSPLHERTAQMKLARFEFLKTDRSVICSTFGESDSALRATVNQGQADYVLKRPGGQDIVLPPGGFLVESSDLVSFCSTSWGGVSYSTPTLFVLRTLDGKPLGKTTKIRVFHGFGDDRLVLNQKQFRVTREALLEFP